MSSSVVPSSAVNFPSFKKAPLPWKESMLVVLISARWIFARRVEPLRATVLELEIGGMVQTTPVAAVLRFLGGGAVGVELDDL